MVVMGSRAAAVLMKWRRSMAALLVTHEFGRRKKQHVAVGGRLALGDGAGRGGRQGRRQRLVIAGLLDQRRWRRLLRRVTGQLVESGMAKPDQARDLEAG